MPDISAGGDNSHLAWISYPREVVPEAEWSPQEKESLAVRKNRNTVMVLNTAFFNVDPPRMDEVNKTPPPPDLGKTAITAAHPLNFGCQFVSKESPFATI